MVALLFQKPRLLLVVQFRDQLILLAGVHRVVRPPDTWIEGRLVDLIASDRDHEGLVEDNENLAGVKEDKILLHKTKKRSMLNVDAKTGSAPQSTAR